MVDGGACRSCGTQTPLDARFCPECGAVVGQIAPGTLTALVVPAPPGTGDTPSPRKVESPKRARTAVALGLGALVAIAALIVVTVLRDTADDDAANEPSPTEQPEAPAPSPPDLETGGAEDEAQETRDGQAREDALKQSGPLVWEQAQAGVGSLPLGFATLDSDVYSFASSELTRSGRVRGVTAAVSQDNGLTWKQLGEILAPPAEVQRVTTSNDRLVAAGVVGNEVTVWESTDARAWSATTLDTVPEGHAVEVVALEANGSNVVVFTRSIQDPFRQVAEALEARPELAGVSYSAGWTPSTVYALGPLSMVLASYSGPELGLDLQTMSLGVDEPRQRGWAREGSGPWVQIDRDLGAIERAEAFGREGFRAVGVEESFTRAWESPDGRNWIPDERTRPQALQWHLGADALALNRWGDRWNFSFRKAAGAWQELELFDILPDSANWLMTDLAANATAIAIAVSGNSKQLEPATTTGVLSVDGYQLRLDNEAWEIVVSKDNDELSRVRLGLGSATQPFTVDLEANTVTFLVSRGGDPLVTVTVDELATLEDTAPRYFRQSVLPPRVLVSTDLTTWSAGRVDASTEGADLGLTHVWVTDTTVLATGTRNDAADPSEINAGIWVAPWSED